MDRKERQEKIELYGRGFELLTEALKDIPFEMWKFKPAPAEWSVHEVLVHLADSESNAALRARKLIVEPMVPDRVGAWADKRRRKYNDPWDEHAPIRRVPLSTTIRPRCWRR